MRKSQMITLSSEYQMNKSQILGKGSTGEVYLGKQLSTGQPVAIKLIRLQTIDNQVTEYLLRMQKLALSTISHQNVLKGLKIIQNSSKCYMITQLCNGGTLKNLIRKQGKIKQQQALNIIKGILKGYNALVRKGIVHRDLKPANIMLHNSIPKIIDFGYCQIQGYQKPSLQYNVGSPSYMAPESFQNNVYNQKTQIWAIGIILFQCLMGKTFDDGKHMSQIFKTIKKFGIPFGKQVSQKSRKVIKWCLEFDPNKRPTTIELISYLIQQKPGQPEFFILNKNDRKKSNSLLMNNFVTIASHKRKDSNFSDRNAGAQIKKIYQRPQKEQKISNQTQRKSQYKVGLICKTDRNNKVNADLNNGPDLFKRQKNNSIYRVLKNQYQFQSSDQYKNGKVFTGQNVQNKMVSQHISYTPTLISPRDDLIKRVQKKDLMNVDKNPESLRQKIYSKHSQINDYYPQNYPSLTFRNSQRIQKFKMGIKKQNLQQKPGQFIINSINLKRQNQYQSNGIKQNYQRQIQMNNHTNSIYHLNNYIAQKKQPVSIFTTISTGKRTYR